MLSTLNRFALWVDANYEKIWLIVMITSLVLFVLGIVFNSEAIYDMSEDISDFYDEILSE